jgi:hypothetical protein
MNPNSLRLKSIKTALLLLGAGQYKLLLQAAKDYATKRGIRT